MRRIAAAIVQLLSYATTLGLAHHLIRPTDSPTWLFTVVTALLGEGMFFGMKEAFFAPGVAGKAVGLFGFTCDGLINAGGILAVASRLLTFAPIALMLGAVELDISDPSTFLIASISLSLVLGIALSVIPHILWRQKQSRSRGTGGAR